MAASTAVSMSQSLEITVAGTGGSGWAGGPRKRGQQMISCFPKENTIHTALSLATRAPSVGDVQPWLWRVGTQSLHLYADANWRGAHTDAEDRDTLLSCGASLHHCLVALAAMGWRARVQRLPDAAEPEHLAALELYPHSPSALDV